MTVHSATESPAAVGTGQPDPATIAAGQAFASTMDGTSHDTPTIPQQRARLVDGPSDWIDESAFGAARRIAFNQLHHDELLFAAAGGSLQLGSQVGNALYTVTDPERDHGGAGPGPMAQANIDLAAAHLRHAALANAGAIDDPLVAPFGPMLIPQHDHQTGEILHIAFQPPWRPAMPDETHDPAQGIDPATLPHAMQRDLAGDAFRRELDGHGGIDTEFRIAGEAALRSFTDSASGHPGAGDGPHTATNIALALGHIRHELFTNLGLIQDPAVAPTGPMLIPQHDQATGEVVHVPFQPPWRPA